MKSNKIKEFEKAVKPALKWLKKYGDPYTNINITTQNAEVTQGQISVPFKIQD